MSFSQYNQEQFIINYFKNKNNGIFVEVGGLDGKRHSNTYLLETKFNWSGLIIEPSPSLFLKLQKNRKCYTENYLVGEKNEENVDFLYIENEKGPDGLQGIYKNYNINHINRINKELKITNTKSKIIKKKMIPIQFLFDKYNLINIDYFSLDVEGSELEVLKGINFEKMNIKIFGIEFNYPKSNKSKEILKLLKENKYIFLKKLGSDLFFIKI
jgi:FkbM family methyltransferase